MKRKTKGILIIVVLLLITGAVPLTGSAQALPGGSLDPTLIPKYVDPLVIPPVMPRTDKVKQKGAKNIDYYEIAVRQFQQQILPAAMPMTTVWSYGSVNHPATFNYPAFTIEAKVNKPVRVKWINDLKDPLTGRYLPHLLPVDPTLHWTNPPGPIDTRPVFTDPPAMYTGPVPIVTHVHGAHVGPESDGYPEAWYLPAANNLAGFTPRGSRFDQISGVPIENGSAVFQYPNTQRATTLWYHDHALGITRLNVYAGPAGFYLLRGGGTDLPGGTLPGPAPQHGDPPGLRYYEIPIVIQDRSFNSNGSLFYPDSRSFFDGFAGPFIPISDVSPVWNPEFFGNTMVVNGKTWPYLDVEPRKYRFRFLNGCNSRFLILQFNTSLPFWQVGADGGFLPAPVLLNDLLVAPAERADVVVDFSGFAPGTTITLLNLGPDEPFGGGIPGVDFFPSDPGTTGQVMQFRVVPPVSVDLSINPAQLVLPPVPLPAPVTNVRRVSLNEEMSATTCVDANNAAVACDSPAAVDFAGPIAAKLGTLDAVGMPMPMMWADAITENPALGATEIWEIYNFTEDAHPIHLHLVQFQVVNREGAFGIQLPNPWETGFKDTVIAYPGEITRVVATFDMAGLYVWHCHILEHEDNEMMRPFFVGTMP